MDKMQLRPCPFCGSGKVHMKEMDASIQHQMYAICGNCESTGPVRVIARAAAKAWNRRAEPANRALTLEEVKRHCESGVSANPLWAEFANVQEISRWMVVSVPDMCFNGGTIKTLMISMGHKYNTQWRCWLRKPTDEEAAGTPWEGENGR